MALTLIGLSIGLLLFLVAAGLTLIFGLLGVINFAHGAFYMLGAYIGYQAVASTGSFWLALALTPLIVLPNTQKKRPEERQNNNNQQQVL